ncbi:MAG TPA: hypothetical protein VNV66_12390 [Pilimelia sp.]|nr:hypothetical protein [Pilimelia sp.]
MDMRLRRFALPLIAAALLLPAAACADADPSGDSAQTGTSAAGSTSAGTPTTPAPTTRATPTKISLIRTGGLAGVNETVTVEVDGSWSYRAAGDHARKPAKGQLTPAALSQLRDLLARPSLADEARSPAGKAGCRDGFHYVLDTGSLQVNWDACANGAEPDTASAVARLLASHTPL